MTKTEKAITDTAKWEKFRKVIHEVESKALAPNGRIYITGYAQFFPPPVEDDACDKTYFFPINLLAVLPMKYATRLRMNDLVDMANSRIESITSKFDSVAFVDIDALFAGRQFCEPENADDSIGANNPNVWFNDLTTPLEEDAVWNPETVDSRPEADPWAAWALGLPESVKNDTDLAQRAIWDNLQRASSFHPKKAAHVATAIKVGNMILKDFWG